MAEYRITVELPRRDFQNLVDDLIFGGYAFKDEKWCPNCEHFKPREDFHQQNSNESPDLMTTQCKKCRNGRNSTRNRERARNGQ